ncbi:FACT complex subunit SSRP1-like [Entelurus aequoreus]|uniref:FACT complex subunit SSRP1-like n=1 Tax=Entelurus aequoreus TaxID=161455 RepID=UPI002B1DEF3F|nr:FACT complex subunit SSRP1-like [Entelurus aequoreus]XP_061899393.1 FACT complex subunit SSRP1-like [Entelurus aequoreus]XP_061899394.1 FACT complex subunit SSRP1-like [Entelurus aequoreus]XP_061899395.1 FACT complex subunit SSRP1-like [Entelurus aequoreus]XP_061899396.1 FACT complex subunit SSRP1-like [Entelurus aequoreus]XP_061899397.1 FACT complex subunit SSRP1-like [Entelurus aequoreus]
MGDTLEFNEIYQEVKGSWNDGRLRFSKQNVVYKSSKTGKVDNIPAGDLSLAQWRRVCLGHGIKLTTSTGHIYKYDGFRDTDFEKISEFFKANYSVELTEKDLCVKGWNWGTAKFSGPLLSFDVNDNTAFEVPLANVSQCATGKNEVTLEFHQNDDTEVSLMEVRFYVPPSQSDERQDPVEAFAQNVLSKADVIQATGDAVCIFKELHCLTPRGRYDIRIYPTFLHLHGKTFDYKIPYTTVLRLFLLPHKDQRQMFFVISLDPPIKQGQTRYHFLILLFSKEETIELSLNMSEDEVERRFEGKLSKDMSGSLYEMVSRVMKALVNRKITVPGNFQGHSGGQCITCSYKASSGLLYPLERGFIYVHKPPVHLRFEEISCVNFARGTTTTRSFDFEIESKQGNQYTFSSIEREEYGKLFDFVNAKKLNIKNRGFKEGMKGNINEYSDSDEDQHDAYLERMKAEGKIREEGNDSDDSDSGSDESFNPGEEDDDIAEEYDSKASASDSSEEGGSGSEEDGSKKQKVKKPKEVKVKKERKERKPRREKKQRDGPKRPMSAYMLWLNSSRERIKSENPGISITEISKKAGEMWRQLGKDDKEEWDIKAVEAKKQYEIAMKEYKESGGGGEASISKKEARKSGGKKEEKKRKSSGGDKERERSSGGGNESFKSKEFIETSESSSDSDHKSKSKKKKKKKKESEEEEEEAASSPASSEGASD